MSAHLMQRSEEGIGASGAEVIEVVSGHVGAGPSGRAASILNHFLTLLTLPSGHRSGTDVGFLSISASGGQEGLAESGGPEVMA